MKQTFKILLSALLIISMVFSSMILVNAETVNTENRGTISCENLDKVIVGDVNMDGKIAINDATVIQHYLARLLTPTNEMGQYVDKNIESDYELSFLVGDVNGDNSVSILDASIIQHYLAKYPTQGDIGKVVEFMTRSEKQEYYDNYFNSEDFLLNNVPEKKEIWSGYVINKLNGKEMTIEMINAQNEKAILISDEHNSWDIAIDRNSNIMVSTLNKYPYNNKYICKNDKEAQNYYKEIEERIISDFTDRIVKVLYGHSVGYDTDIILIILETSDNKYLILEAQVNWSTKRIESIVNASDGIIFDHSELLEKTGYTDWHRKECNAETIIHDIVEVHLTTGSASHSSPLESYNFNNRGWEECTPLFMANELLQNYTNILSELYGTI